MIDSETVLSRTAGPLESRSRPSAFADWTRAFAYEARARSQSFTAATFYDVAERAEFEGQLDVAGRVRDQLARPGDLRATEQQGEAPGILLEWTADPRLAAIAATIAKNPALKAGCRVDRWRVGEEPAVIATVPLDATSYLDTSVGPRGGAWTYRVRTFVSGKAADGSLLAEERASDLVSVSRSESFDLKLIAGDTTKVTMEVTVSAGTGKKAARFDAHRGEKIGGRKDVDGATIDFSTDLTVEEIVDVDDVRDLTLRHPVFNPDGSRRTDESGKTLIYRDEIRKVPVRRLEVRLKDGAGATRALSIDR